MNMTKGLSLVLCLLATGCWSPEQPQAQDPATTAAASTPSDAAPAAAAAAVAPVASAIDEGGPVSLQANVSMPAGFEASKVEAGECMTPVDSFNNAAVTSGIYAAGGELSIVGWNVTSSKDVPVPTAIFGVFKPYDPNQKGELLTGAREARADLASQDKRYEMAGYRLNGKFPATPGKYRLYVWTGDSQALTECDSRVVIQVQ